jgi:predicted Zn-dependent peptidase
VDRWDYFYTACRKVHGDHPLAYSPIGTCSSLIAITEDDVQSFFHDYYAGKNMILICVGAIQFDELVRAAADELEILRSEGLEWPDYVQPSVHKMPVTYKSHEYYGVTICGYRTCGYLAKDYYALWFLSDHLQESLYDDIRIQGFTYTFEVHYTAYMGEGLFHFYFRALGTAAGRIEQTIDEAVRQTKDSLIDDATFLEKKEGLVNSFRNRISDRDELSECLADFVEHYKRGRELRHDFEELEALTPERIKTSFIC